jgi:NitT/TauT family transport system substrate-binding protein
METVMTSNSLDAKSATRRKFVVRAAALGLAGPLGLVAGKGFALPRVAPFDPTDFPICRAAATGEAPPDGELKKVTFAWNAGAPCLLAVTVAKDKGFFAKHGLDVDLVNYAGSTDQLLETLATGKADAAVGMALRWLKPLEQGFDVKIIASLHGGCMRLLVPAGSSIDKVEDLKGKIIGVSDMNSPAKNFFAIVIRKAGLDPNVDVEFKQFPAPLLQAAVDKGEAHAVADGDPNTFMWLKDGKMKEIYTNLSGEYANRTCCIVRVRGSLVRDDRRTAASIALALLDGAEYAAQNPAEAAATYAPFAAGKVAPEDLTALAKYHTHHHHPVGEDLKKELALYAEELKLVSVFKPSMDTAKYAERIYADVLN